jgi:hypothetical protein
MIVEVNAAHQQFISDPAVEKYVLKPVKRYLRFVAVQNVEEQSPALDDFDGPEIEVDNGCIKGARG